MNKQFIAILVVIVGGLFGILVFTGNNKNSGSSNNASAQPSAHITGKTDSEVNLTEYGDFQCPACKAYYPIVKQLKAEYADRVAFQFSNFPLTQIHRNAFISARAGEAAAKQGKFFEMHDLLYENQDSWSNLSDPTPTFVAFAAQLGLNADKFKTDMNSSEVSDIINADRKIIQDLGGSGTPSFVLNGKKIDSPRSIDDFKKVLDEALANNQ